MNEKTLAAQNWLKIGALIFYAGALTYTVANHETRLNRIEARGSPPIEEHKKLDDAREERVRAEIAELKSGVATFQKMQVDMAKLTVTVEGISHSIARLETNVKP